MIAPNRSTADRHRLETRTKQLAPVPVAPIGTEGDHLEIRTHVEAPVRSPSFSTNGRHLRKGGGQPDLA